MIFGTSEDLVRERVREHERFVARLALERQALACQRDYREQVKRAPVIRRPSWFGTGRFAFGG